MDDRPPVGANKRARGEVARDKNILHVTVALVLDSQRLDEEQWRIVVMSLGVIR